MNVRAVPGCLNHRAGCFAQAGLKRQARYGATNIAEINGAVHHVRSCIVG